MIITEGEITKTIKAKLMQTVINHEEGHRVVSALRFYEEGNAIVPLKLINATLEGVTPESSDLQDVLDLNPIT